MPGNSKQNKMELMVRPAFPFFYCESEEPLEAPSNVLVFVREMWKVGHLVDYLCDGCYWSGMIVKLLGENKFLVELIKPPMGEGGCFEVLSKDLRPSLDWTPELGWTVPSTMCTEDFHSGVRLVQPCIEDGQILGDHLVENGRQSNVCRVAPFSVDASNESERNACIHTSCQNSLDMSADLQHQPSESGCAPSSINALDEEMLEVREQMMDPDHPQVVEVDSQSSASSPNPHSKSPEPLQQSLEIKESDSSFLPEASLTPQCGVKYISCTGITESSRRSCDIPQKRSDDCSSSAVKHFDPLESSIMELEELANKIAWLKGLLKFGIGSSNAMKSAWKFQAK